ncbi:P-loop containing nucleoside triphosphate hydrolase [Gracilaria domingensis]|nr:P-loop containing nucleoside triphosphate hydrolase [Gracilaria domingensis]
MRIVVAGNPGVGKSAILNGIIGTAKFPSGISIAKGMTEVLQNVSFDNKIYSDTPGLNDEDMREQAAKEISKAFEGGGLFKLLFVVTLEAGRVRPSDLATIDTILDAIKKVNVETDKKYSVIVNKCEEQVLQALENPQAEARLRAAFNRTNKVDNIGFMCMVPEAQGQENHILSANYVEKYNEFFETAPVFDLPPYPPVEVRPIPPGTIDKMESYLKDLYDSRLVPLGAYFGVLLSGAIAGPAAMPIGAGAGAGAGVALFVVAKGIKRLFK